MPTGEGADGETAPNPDARPLVTPARQALPRRGPMRDELERRAGTAPVARRASEGRVESRAARSTGTRTGPSLLDHASLNLGYIRTDLVRIAVLATVMVLVIVALTFVLA